MKSYSQAKQDLFVLEVLKNKRNGLFLDIGCGHPNNINNTFLLESEFDWSGVCVDVDESLTEKWEQRKKSKFINNNALTLDYEHIIKQMTDDNIIDYLSLDLEPASITFECLQKIPFDKYIFSVITYEHDYYRFGDAYRTPSRNFLINLNYVIVNQDVGDDGQSFEDWYIHKSLL
jgi:hypothetical protein